MLVVTSINGKLIIQLEWPKGGCGVREGTRIEMFKTRVGLGYR